MNLRLRRLTYGLAFAAFFLLAPLLMLYASGYRYNRSSLTLNRVGGMYVKSYPAGATVILDGVLTGESTPTRLLNVRPGLHTITITLNGFAPWQKTLSVESGETTFIRDVVLYRATPESLQSLPGGTNLLRAPNKTMTVYLGDDERVHLINIQTRNHFAIQPNPRAARLLALSPSLDQVVYATTGGGYAILNLNTEKVTALPMRLKNVTKLVWDPVATTTLWALADTRLYSYVLGSPANPVLVAEHVYDVAIANGNLYQLGRIDSNYEISSQTLDSKQELWTIKLASPDTLAIQDVAPGGMLTLQGTYSLWLVDPRNASGLTSFDASMSSWHDQRILMANEFEIRVYHVDTKESTLIDRSSDSISDVAWHPNGSYFLRRSNNLYEMVEMDGRDNRNSVPMFITSEPAELLFDNEGKYLFSLTTSSSSWYQIQ